MAPLTAAQRSTRSVKAARTRAANRARRAAEAEAEACQNGNGNPGTSRLTSTFMDESASSSSVMSFAQETLFTKAEDISSMSSPSSSARGDQDITSNNAVNESASINPVTGSADLATIPSSTSVESVHPTPDKVKSDVGASNNATALIQASSSSDDKVLSEPLTTFTCFGKLPPELRIIIWKIIARHPAVIEFNMRYGMYWTGYKPLIKGFDIKHVKPTLSINKESRAVILPFYTALTLKNWTGGSMTYGSPTYEPDMSWDVRFNPAVDTIFFTHFRRYLYSGIQSFYCEWDDNQEELAKIRRIAFGSPSYWFRYSLLEVDYHWFPNLTEVTLCIGDLNNNEFMAGNFSVLEDFAMIGEYEEKEDVRSCIREHKENLEKCLEEGMWSDAPPTFRICIPTPRPKSSK